MPEMSQSSAKATAVPIAAMTKASADRISTRWSVLKSASSSCIHVNSRLATLVSSEFHGMPVTRDGKLVGFITAK